MQCIFIIYRYSIIWTDIVFYDIIENTIQYNNITWYSGINYDMIWYNMNYCDRIWFDMIWYICKIICIYVHTYVYTFFCIYLCFYGNIFEHWRDASLVWLWPFWFAFCRTNWKCFHILFGRWCHWIMQMIWESRFISSCITGHPASNQNFVVLHFI